MGTETKFVYLRRVGGEKMNTVVNFVHSVTEKKGVNWDNS